MNEVAADINFCVVVERCYNGEVCGWIHLTRKVRGDLRQISVAWAAEKLKKGGEWGVTLGDFPRTWRKKVVGLYEEILCSITEAAHARHRQGK